MLCDWLCTHEKQLNEIIYSHNTLAQICEKGYVNYLIDSCSIEGHGASSHEIWQLAQQFFDRNPTFQSKQQKNRGIWVYIFIIKIFPFYMSKEKITSFKRITSNNHRALHFRSFIYLPYHHHMWSQSN